MKLSKAIHLCPLPSLVHTLKSHTGTQGLPAPRARMGLVSQWPAVTCVAVVQPDPLPIVFAAAPHHVVREIGLCHLELGVHNHLG